MPESIETIIARYRQNPDYATLYELWGKERVALNDAERETTFQTWAVNERAGQIEEEAAQARKTLRAQVRLALATLDTNVATLTGPPAPTPAQVRDAALSNARILRGVINALIDARIVEPDGG